jgi:hypothetical protein
MKINIRILSVIAATMIIGFPVSAKGMSARPPIIFEQIEAGIYLQKDSTQNSKTLVHDKNGKVIGWARKSYLDSNKTILYDMNNNVKGYLKKDLMDFWMLRFVNK